MNNNTALRLKCFKRIKSEISVLDFGHVNYFVGKNGSGKTSILNAISYLNDGSNSRHFFIKDSLVELEINGRKQWITWNDGDLNKTSHQGDLNLQIIFQKEQVSEKGANGVSALDFSYNDIKKYHFDYINKTLHYLGLEQLTVERIIKNDDPWDNSVGKRIFRHRGDTINPHFLSSGLKSFNNINHSISKGIENIKDRVLSPVDAILIILEEPENNLHPDLHKKIPRFIQKFIGDQEDDIKSKLYFFISTHSPFVVSSASNFKNHKFYLVDDGYLLSSSLEKSNQSSGVVGRDCAHLISIMLGGDVTDLGYPENYCILEEYSLQKILENSLEERSSKLSITI